MVWAYVDNAGVIVNNKGEMKGIVCAGYWSVPLLSMPPFLSHRVYRHGTRCQGVRRPVAESGQQRRQHLLILCLYYPLLNLMALSVMKAMAFIVSTIGLFDTFDLAGLVPRP